MSIIEVEVKEPRATMMAPKMFQKTIGGNTFAAAGYSLFVNDVEVFRMYSDSIGKAHFAVYDDSSEIAGVDSITLDAIGSERDLGDCPGCKPLNA